MPLRKFKLRESFICNECVFVFSIHTPLKGRRGARQHVPNCPNCGDRIEVKELEHVIEKRPANRNWTAEEIELIDKCIEGELLPYQVAFKTNRTKWSVRHRLHRRKKELGLIP